MTIIAIVGRPGSGKTTISKYVDESYEEISYLGIDEYTNEHKDLLKIRDDGLEDVRNGINCGKNENKYYFLISKVIKEWVEEQKNIGTKYALIDFAMLQKVPEVWNLFDYKILVSKDRKLIKKHLSKRCAPERAEALCMYGDGLLKEFNENFEYDFEIINNENLEDLYNKSQLIFDLITKKNYTYFMIKPDGLRHTKEIHDMLKPFFNDCYVSYYKVDNYKEIIRKLYYELFTIEKLQFDKTFDYMIDTLTNLYGNQGILVLVHKKCENEKDYQTFINEAYNLKHEIRNRYINKDIRILIQNKKNYNLNENVTYDGINYFVSISKLLSLVHCPEPIIKDTKEELDILNKSNIIMNSNIIDIEKIKDKFVI